MAVRVDAEISTQTTGFTKRSKHNSSDNASRAAQIQCRGRSRVRVDVNITTESIPNVFLRGS